MSQENYAILGKEVLDKNLFNDFLNDEIKVKKLKEFQQQIAQRFGYIVYIIAKLTEREIGWFDYDNEDGNGTMGYFNTDYYRWNVIYTGVFTDLKSERFTDYDTNFPTKWFVENFEEGLKSEVDKYFFDIALEKKKRSAFKEENDKLRLSFETAIRFKLTPEELCFIKFLNDKELQEVLAIQKKQKAKKEKSEKAELSNKLKRFKDLNIDVKGLYSDYRKNSSENEYVQDFSDWLANNEKNLIHNATVAKNILKK